MTTPRDTLPAPGQQGNPGGAELGAAAPVSGLLNIDKPQGMTSHDVVAIVRRIARQRQVGHAGTLDPLATGVLIVALGAATRVVEYVANADKVYRATIRFGVTTDTWDAEGRATERCTISDLSLGAIEQALPAFTGEIQQMPPMYSAIKRDGQPLYKLARQGLVVERQPRTVTIHRLHIENWSPPDLTLCIECSKGTYVRSLAHDLGQAVRTGAHLAALARLAIGRFHLEDAVSLEVLRQGAASGAWRQHLLPPHLALCRLPGIMVDEDTARRVGFGQAVELPGPADAGICYVYTKDRRFLALLSRDTADGWWHPHKVILSL